MRFLVCSFGLAVLVCAIPLRSHAAYKFETVIHPSDPTFDQLLGINDRGTIAGYFGSGSAGHPNNGFTLVLPNSFTNENFPGSVQTQVIGINTAGDTDGFYIDTVSVTHGFTDIGGSFTTVDFPGSVLTQLLGLNDHDEAAGYWSDATGTQFPVTVQGLVFTPLNSLLPANTSAQATGVNNAGEVSGFYVTSSGETLGFLLNGATLTSLQFPGSTFTQALGLNNLGQVVGAYVDASAAMHGFVYNIASATFQSIDDPFGVGTTTVNGINDHNQLVGFYVDSAGNTDGFVATVVTPTPVATPAMLVLLAALLVVVSAWSLERRAR